MRFTIYRNKRKNWYWTLRARNGRIIADSAEGYKRKIDCVRQVSRIKRDAGDAVVLIIP